jgi:RNA polymerase sigma factor (sigma-70 family)
MTAEAGPVSRRTDAELYEEHAAELIRFATFLVGPVEAADALSAAVLQALASRAWREAQVDNHRAYLYRAVLNECRQHHRRRERRLRPVAAGPAAALVSPEPQPEVVAAVRGLSPQQRAVVFLTYWQDLDRATVAATLGVSDGTVRRQLARAHARLRKELHV